MQHFRTLVVDDVADFRRLLRSMLEERTECEVVGEASDGLQAVVKAEQLQPDLVLLDLGLPTINGIEVARRIRKLSPSPRSCSSLRIPLAKLPKGHSAQARTATC